MDRRVMPQCGGLKEPVRKFEETFSAEILVLDKFKMKSIKEPK